LSCWEVLTWILDSTNNRREKKKKELHYNKEGMGLPFY